MPTDVAAPVEAPLMISVSGVRGIVGKTMTPLTAAKFAGAWASHVRSGLKPDAPFRMVLARDTRPSGAMLADAVRAALAAAGAEVIDLGVVTTPTAGVMIGELGAAAGMVVTASHNPWPWNGLKCLDASGVAPAAHEAHAVIARYHAGDLDEVDAHSIPSASSSDDGHRVHIDRVLKLVDVERIRTKKFKVVLDSVNGAGCVAGRMLLEELGCELVHLHGEPTGRFAHTPEPTKENLTELAERVRTENAVCGFAQDPDADRLAIVDERGAYIGEEYTLVLTAWRLLERQGAGHMAANLSTSRMLDDLAKEFDCPPVARTAVGEANVAAGLREAAAAGGGDGAAGIALVGGEGNGGVIVPAVGWVRDSLSAMALVLDALADRANTLSAMISTRPAYAMIKDKLDVAGVGGRDAIPGILDRVRVMRPDAELNDADGVRLDFPDAGAWVHVRPSNTEPILRIIAEARDDDAARALVDAVRALL